MKRTRNFCIIAHIDHGKSTLADRLLQSTGTVSDRDMQAQLLDDMDLERERGITIKSHAIQMDYNYKGEQYTLNLIDTPGHVDFSYEVSRSIAACEGALLIVDASQGVEAQTISNLYLALEHDLEIIPVLNKIDLPGAMPEEMTDQVVELLGCDPEDVIHASGKEGLGIEDILSAIVEKVPAPKGDPDEPLQAMIFDSQFNSYRGIEVIFRVFNGTIKKGDKIKFVNTNKTYNADEIGILRLKQDPQEEISAGNVGYLISGIKVAKEVKVGDTVHCTSGELIEKNTTPPKHFTDATILSALTGIARYVTDLHIKKALKETDGLGTEATRAGIIELLFKRGFLTRVAKDIRATEVGRQLIISLPDAVSYPDMTAHWESQLTAISQRELNYAGFLEPMTNGLENLLAQVKGVTFHGLAGKGKAPYKAKARRKSRVKKPASKAWSGLIDVWNWVL